MRMATGAARRSDSAAGLEGTKLLMIHNVEDDNVHFQNSMQMAEALEKAGKQFYMLVYPQKTHGVAGPEHKQLLEAKQRVLRREPEVDN